MYLSLFVVTFLISVLSHECKANPVIITAGEDKTPFTLEEVLTGGYRSIGFAGTWISGTEYIYMEEVDVLLYDVVTGKSEIFLRGDILDRYGAFAYTVSPDRKHVLIAYDYEPGFRHSSKSKYVVYTIENEKYTHLANESLLSYATWAKKDSKLAFVLNNNIYYVSTPGAEEVKVTSSGVPGVVYNGVPDWVYEEEVLGSGYALWFSPNGNRIAFIEFNDENVDVVTYLTYGIPGELKDQYPQEVHIRYPKSGRTNPTVKVYVADLDDSSKVVIHELPTPIETVSRDHIIYGISWANNDEVAAVWANRIQNLSVTVLYNLYLSTQQTIYKESNAKGWVSPQTPLFNKEGNKFLSIVPQKQEDGNNFYHLTVFDRVGSSAAAAKGYSTDFYIIGWDEKNNLLYYVATEENKPSTRQVFSVKHDGTNRKCLSCRVKSPEGNECAFATATFSLDLSHYILYCTGPDPQIVYLYKANANEGELLKTLQDNTWLRIKLASKLLPSIFKTEIDIPGGFKAQVKLLLPPNFDDSGKTKYPLLIDVYAGPDSYQVTDSFSVGFPEYMTSNLSTIYGFIDGRGSGVKGSNILFSNYKNLGSLEIDDQISVTRELQNKYNWIDRNRTAIWGWSYGGYATARTLEKDVDGVFKCGISVAPVTDWIYYDSIYTERYMGLPTNDNEKGYEGGSVLYNVSNLHNKQYFLIHGSGDDNVHYQQSMLFAKTLEGKDILFRQQSYTDENHSIGGFQFHLYHSMNQFWKSCFEL